MKILVVCTVPFEINGIVNVIMNYYTNMKSDSVKFDFIVHTNVDERLGNRIEDNGDKVFTLPNRKKNVYSYIRHLQRILEDGKYDIMHVHGNSALMEIELFAARKIKIKKIVHAHSTQCTYKILNRLLYDSFMKSYDYALACSQASGKWLYKERDFIVFHNSIDANKYKFSMEKRCSMRKMLNIPEESLVIGHVGQFYALKNQEYLLSILEDLVKRKVEAVLILVGDGEQRHYIEHKSQELNIYERVIFTGITDKVQDYMQAMDVFAMPSTHEGLPLVGVEAQAAGLPCIFSDVITREMKMTESVEFLPITIEASIWSEYILKLYNSSDREKGVKCIQEAGYDIKKNASKLLEFYYKVANGV